MACIVMQKRRHDQVTMSQLEKVEMIGGLKMQR
jgi:hypothetical protein